jgi:small subunit ribosomal protein S6
LNNRKTVVQKNFLIRKIAKRFRGSNSPKGGKKMNRYEVLYIIQNELSDEQKAALIEKFKSIIESSGGIVESIDKWGVRKYAYPIDYKTEGYYVLMNFVSEPTVPHELERQMQITDGFVRKLILKK